MPPETTPADLSRPVEAYIGNSSLKWIKEKAWEEEYAAIQSSAIAKSVYEMTKSRAAAVLALETETDLISGKVGKEEFTRTAKTIAALAEKLNLPLTGEAGLNTDVRGLAREILDLREAQNNPLNEPGTGEIVSRWLDPNFASVRFRFVQGAGNAVQFNFCLNHLLTMAELRRFNKAIGQPFDKSLLRKLRNGSTMFATAGKITAQHLPLPRPDLIQGDYVYQIGSRLYKAGQITPRFHAGSQFLNENTSMLPITDFRPEIITTQIREKEKSIVVEKLAGIATKSIVGKVAPSAKRFFYREFGSTSNDPRGSSWSPWSVCLLKDPAIADVFWAELIVLSAEQGVDNRRQHAAPYLVRIKAKPEIMEAFKDQLEQAINRCKSDNERHELCYFLTSVLYFQADPDHPYLTPDIMPGTLNGDLPFELNSIILGVKEDITEAPGLFRQALKQADGFDAVEALYNTKHEGRKPAVSQIARAGFGSEYENLASAVKAGLDKIAVEMEEGVGKEVDRRSRRNAIFEQRWRPLKVEMVKAVGEAFGFRKVATDSPEYDRIAAMMKMEDEASNAKAIHERSNPDTNKIVQDLQIYLILNAGTAYISQLAENILQAAPEKDRGRLIIKKGFVKKWNSLVGEAERKWNIPKALINRRFVQQLDSDLRFSLGYDNVKAIAETIEKI